MPNDNAKPDPIHDAEAQLSFDEPEGDDLNARIDTTDPNDPALAELHALDQAIDEDEIEDEENLLY